MTKIELCEDCKNTAIAGYDDNTTPERDAVISAGLERLGWLIFDWQEWGDGHEEFTNRTCACCRVSSGNAGAHYQFIINTSLLQHTSVLAE